MSEAGRIRLEAKEQNSACKAVLYSRHCAEQPAQLPPDNDCDDQYTDQRCLVSWQHSLVIADAAIVTLASFKRDSSSSGATSMIFVYLFSRWPILPSVRPSVRSSNPSETATPLHPSLSQAFLFVRTLHCFLSQQFFFPSQHESATAAPGGVGARKGERTLRKPRAVRTGR